MTTGPVAPGITGGGHQRGRRGGRSKRGVFSQRLLADAPMTPDPSGPAAWSPASPSPTPEVSWCGAGAPGVPPSQLPCPQQVRSSAGGSGSKGGRVEPPSWTQTTTSIMLRNIPNRYTTEELIAELMDWGFEGAFDFFYLPIDFKTKRNKGYGFLNFRSHILARRFHDTFNQRKLVKYGTQKVLETQPAVTQGLEQNIRAYHAQAERVQNPWFKPMIFVQTNIPETPWCGVPLCDANFREVLEPVAVAECHSEPSASPTVISIDQALSECSAPTATTLLADSSTLAAELAAGRYCQHSNSRVAYLGRNFAQVDSKVMPSDSACVASFSDSPAGPDEPSDVQARWMHDAVLEFLGPTQVEYQ